MNSRCNKIIIKQNCNNTLHKSENYEVCYLNKISNGNKNILKEFIEKILNFVLILCKIQ